MATPLTSPDIEYLGGTVARAQVGLGRDALRRLRRNKLALVAGVYLVLLAVVCVISLFWTPYRPNAIGTCQTYELPSASHPLGCDDLGRDSLSRLGRGAPAPANCSSATSSPTRSGPSSSRQPLSSPSRFSPRRSSRSSASVSRRPPPTGAAWRMKGCPRSRAASIRTSCSGRRWRSR